MPHATPAKHVRFDGIPPTPPSTYSYSASLPSSGGPITPPPLQYFGSPHACSPLPAIPSQIHPALGPSTVPHIHYDLSQPPTTLQLHPSMSSHVLAAPATHPPLPCMTIICRYLPWSITVTASGNSKLGPFVTVMDVFNAIYLSLRLGVTGGEFESVPMLEDKHRIDESYKRRYKRIGDRKGYELERSKGIKRIDFLKERNIFTCLSSTTRGPEVWELVVS